MFNDANDFFNTMAEGGNAMRFQDVDGIGPKTAQKIQSVRGVQNPDDVADMSADELSDKAGISHSRATKAIKAGGGNPNRSKRDTTGSVSAAGITYPVGDFRVEAGDQDKARARNDTFTRSEEAIRQDEQKRAPITTDVEKWKNNKAKYDFPGVDTPTQDPKALPKDYKAGDPRTTEVDEESEVATSTGNDLPFMREIGGEREYAGDVANEGPEGNVPGVAPNDFEGVMAGESMIADGLGGPKYNVESGVRETDRPDEEVNPPMPALQAQSRGEVATIQDIPGVDEQSAPARLVEDFNEGLIGMREFADQLEDVESQQEGDGNSSSLPMQPYQSRNSGPPSQIGPYELIQDSQDDGMRSIAYEQPERERTVSFQKRNADLEGPDATVDVWWGENAETVYEGDPDEAFGEFIGVLEERREQNKQRSGSDGIQSPEQERTEALANLFGI